MILVDTNVLVAAASSRDTHHQAATRLLRHLVEPLAVVATVVAEACYLIERAGGPEAEAVFLDAFAEEELQCVPLVAGDFARMAELVRQYADLGLGGTDASVVAVAERLGVTSIATFDHHFRVVRPGHMDAFRLLP